MPYISIDNFAAGMDRSRKRVAGKPGSLWTLKNAHISRGGDIERSHKFETAYTLPAGSRYLAAVRSQLYTFGSADLAATTPVGVQYQRLQAPDDPNLVKVLDAKPFQGKMYVIAEYDDGNIYHFFNGTRVEDWDEAVAADFTPELVAQRLARKLSADEDITASVFGAVVTITARVPGTAFTIAGEATDGGGAVDETEDLTVASVVANVVGVEEVLGTADIEILTGVSDPGTDTINSVTVDGVELLDNAIDWSGSNAATAVRVATSINNGTATHNYSASSDGAVVTISAAPGTGDSVNDDAVVVEVGGTVTVDADAAIAGGVDAVEAVAQVETATISGLIEAEDLFEVTINGTDYVVTGLSSAMGTSIYVAKTRIFSTAGDLWRYCMLATPTVWDPENEATDNDAGFINITEETEGSDALVVATRYQNLAAVMSQGFVSLWLLDSDPANFAVDDTLDNIGTVSPHSVVRYGNNDTFFLDTTGIRSLRARDASNAPFVSDVGNAIDVFIRETLDTLTPQQVLDAVAAIEPKDGRLWIAAGGYIFVLSYFPSPKVSAWSYYQPDEFDDEPVETIVRAGKEIYVRAGDVVYRYGGDYNDAGVSPPLVELPFLSADDPATFKEFKGFDIACVGDWSVDMLYDPNVEARTINLGTVVKTTFNELDINLSGNTTMVGMKLLCTSAGAASISGVQLHFVKEKA